MARRVRVEMRRARVKSMVAVVVGGGGSYGGVLVFLSFRCLWEWQCHKRVRDEGVRLKVSGIIKNNGKKRCELDVFM